MGIKTKSFDPATPSRYKVFERQFVVANAASDNGRRMFAWPFKSRGVIVDIVATIEVIGSITNLTMTPKKNNSAAICSTNGILNSPTDGVDKPVDAKGEIAKPANATRFVLHGTVANRRLSKGDWVVFDFAQSGTTTTGAQVRIEVVVESEDQS